MFADRAFLKVVFLSLALMFTMAWPSFAAPPEMPPSQREAGEIDPSAYVLGPGDSLRILVFGEGDLSGQFVVSQQGVVAYPLLGEVKAAGLTVEAFSRALEARLMTGYVRQPRVSTEVLNYRPFFILGEVNKPGTYPFASNLTVMNAVATAGGFTYRANKRVVFIKHDGEKAETKYSLTSTTSVRPGDTVRIDERRF